MPQEVYEILEPLVSEPQQPASNIASTVGRGLARGGVEAASTLAGIPRGLSELVGSGLQLLGTSPELVQKAQPTFLPTQQEAKTAIKETAQPFLPEGALEPRNRGEEAFDELVSTTTALATPFLGKAPGLLKSLGVSSIGQGAKEVAKLFNFPEETANNIKLGVMIPASIFGTRSNLRKLSKKNYDVAQSAIRDKVLSPEKVRDSVTKLYDQVAQSAGPGREETLKILKPVVKGLSVGNKIPVQKLWDYKKDMNAWLGKYTTPRESRPFIERTSGALNEALKEYGKTNPEFLKGYTVGDQLHGALANQSILDKFYAHNPKIASAIKNPLTQTLLHLPKKIGASVGAVALAPAQIYKIGKIMAKSPEARKVYTQAINDALKQDVRAFVANSGKLDKILGKESKKPEEYYEILE